MTTLIISLILINIVLAIRNVENRKVF